MAVFASAAPSRPPATARTSKRPGEPASTCAQERPIDPVAPRITSRLGVVGSPGREPPTLIFELVSNKLSPLENAGCDIENAVSRRACQSHENTGGDESVQPIHQAAMARNQVAGILDAKPPLEKRFEEIAPLRHRAGRKAEREQHQSPASRRRRRQPGCGPAENADAKPRPGFRRRDPRP